MGQIQQRLLIGVIFCLASGAGGQTPRFYPDDPVWKEPKPRAAGDLQLRKLSDYYDFVQNTFSYPGERQSKSEPIGAKNVNTLGEVPDSPWYTNRHARNPMSPEELARGPDVGNPPSTEGSWVVTKAKSEGVTPGFEVNDSRGMHYWLKFDPLGNAEMATGADVIGSAFFHALGYNVPEYYVVHFDRKQLAITPDSKYTDARGKSRRMSERDVEEILRNVPHDRDGRYRAIASRIIPGKRIGEFRYYGTRKDDPNDTVPHEHRRELRGLFVFCAWLDHEDSRAINTYDALVYEDGVRFVRHYLIDFGSLLGSGSTKPNSPRSGNEYLFAVKPSLVQFFTLGLYVPRWAKADYPNMPSVGRFEYILFEPERFKPDYPNPAFANCLPDDAFWAAKQVMTIGDEHIRAVARKAQFSDPQAETWIVHCLTERRNKVGRAYFAKLLPLDRFHVASGRLAFDDLAVQYGFAAPRQYRIRWFHFDNASNRLAALPEEGTASLPRAVLRAAAGDYFAARIDAQDERKVVTAFLRTTGGNPEIVGIDRTW
ncbi:MAG: hypothetical protein U0Q18_03095 [Bryobacteraceae bacterium]